MPAIIIPTYSGGLVTAGPQCNATLGLIEDRAVRYAYVPRPSHRGAENAGLVRFCGAHAVSFFFYFNTFLKLFLNLTLFIFYF